MNEIKFKKLKEEAVLPTRAHPTDAGLDLTSVTVGEITVEDGKYYYIEYDTGLAVEIPEGHVGIITPRSSISKTSLTLANSIGVIDQGYRGTLKLRFKFDSLAALNLYIGEGSETVVYHKGDKVGQLLIVPITILNPILVKELPATDRGEGSFGSTGV